ncbi:MAG: AMP-binding protein, partial [Nitrospira sp.]|nr:AMP-binding protein [Nitrospira sp.]
MTHQSMVFAAGSIAQYLRLGPDERILGLLPLAFDYGLYQLLMNVLKGGTLILERSFAFPAQIVKRVQEEEATVFPGVPTVYATLLSMRRGMEFELPSVRRVTNTISVAAQRLDHREALRVGRIVGGRCEEGLPVLASALDVAEPIGGRALDRAVVVEVAEHGYGRVGMADQQCRGVDAER